MSHLPIQHKNETTPHRAVRSLMFHARGKLRSIDSCQNGTCADHYQRTNNVGSDPLRYTMWQFAPTTSRTELTAVKVEHPLAIID